MIFSAEVSIAGAERRGRKKSTMAINYLVEKTAMTISESISTLSGKEEAREEVSVTHTSSVKTYQRLNPLQTYFLFFFLS